MKLLRRSSRRFHPRFDYTYPQRAPNLRITNRATLVTAGTARTEQDSERSERDPR